MDPLPPPPDERKEQVEQAKAKRLRLAKAFQEVFGQPNKRTVSQTLVIEHLTVCAGDDANSYRFNEAKDGVALIAAGLHRDGARSQLRIIDRQLKLAATPDEPKRPKPKTKR